MERWECSCFHDQAQDKAYFAQEFRNAFRAGRVTDLLTTGSVSVATNEPYRIIGIGVRMVVLL